MYKHSIDDSPELVPISDTQTLHTFFTTLYGQVHDGWLVLSYPDPHSLDAQGKHPLVSRWYDLAGIDWSTVVQQASAAAVQANLYYGVVVQAPTCVPHPKRRSKTATAYAVPGLWADLDLNYGQHAASTLPQTDADLIDFLGSLPAPPSLLLHSGGGMYPLWLFASPAFLTTPPERQAMSTLSKRLGHTLIERGKARGWTFDNASDLPRILRPPGSINHKYSTLVTVIQETARRYTPSDFDAWLLPLPASPVRTSQDVSEPLTGLPDIATVADHYGAEFTHTTTDEQQGAHPQHGSSTGNNFCINMAKGLWHCWRHNTGGDALTLVAVCEELLACEHAVAGALTGWPFVQAVQRTNTLFGTDIPLRPRSPDTPDMTQGAMITGYPSISVVAIHGYPASVAPITGWTPTPTTIRGWQAEALTLEGSRHE